MRKILGLTVILIATLIAGCGDSGPSKVSKTAKEKPGQATELVQDQALCKEHGVLEALCTQCNPALAAVFKAKGDWCEEHGFPESICPKCHPEKGGKPGVDVAVDDAPADGTKVRLKSAEAARLAGIETVKAGPARQTSEFTAPAVIVYDATRVAQVNARAQGVVKRLYADIGKRVEAGAPLVTIESASVSADQSRLAAVKSRMSVAEASYGRESRLEKKGISAKREVLAAEQELREARAEYEALRASLGIMGASGASGGRYTLNAPFAGMVTQRNVSVDRYVGSESTLFEIVDTSTVWGEVAVSEADLGLVGPGQPVVITVDGLDGRKFQGVISYIAPTVDPQTRTAKARVQLSNPDGFLRANMYGHARITGSVASRASAAVPREAVQRAKSVQIAFVRLSPGEYEARRVKLTGNRREGNLVEVSSNIEPGEDVVVSGSFFLKTETLKDSIGAGCCDVDSKKES